ncbi:uncharacterized protein [Nicotiana tomentosiformis]|uniref:uncharacterized protein n=1 Tax=Nicotiana tomentosiformis TaxID=4098 RepID=UPI00051AB728|nr:uncharacterized protein LOC104120260 [Nicotiana tomentosiformis]
MGCNCARSSESVIFMERLRLLQFLMGLNESYEQARSQILMMTPAPPVNKAYSMLMEAENQRSVTNTFVSAEGTEATALMTTKTGYQAGNQQPTYQAGYQQTGYQ